MFRKTESTPQLDLFTAPSNILPRRAQKKYTDEKAWHNQFFKLVTSRIDEESFRPLFEATTIGALNASVRILVAMSILKEGFGCSDPLPEPASSLIGKTEDYISSLIKAVSDPMKVFCEYLMLVVEKSVWSVLKLRLSTSEQMFNLNATF